MKKLILVATVALAGCATTTGAGPTPADITTIEQNISAYTKKVCSLEPTVAAMLQLIGAFWTAGQPILTLANTIGAAVCSSPTAMATRKAGACPVRLVTAPNGKVIAVADARCVKHG